jgi:stage V sporulation protein R
MAKAKKPTKPKKNKLMYTSGDWTFETIEKVLVEIDKISKEELQLDTFPLQVEIISSDQMLDAYSSHGLPIFYQHWSLGKRHLKDESSYQKGRSGLAYEIIVNTSPTIAYLMENNTMTMQTLVLSHVMGHAHFFKHNYLYKQWTQPEFIVDYLKFAKNYIQQCEERYGFEAVEKILDAAHALQYNSIDRYKRKTRTRRELKVQMEARARYEEENYNSLLSTLTDKKKTKGLPVSELERRNEELKRRILPEPEENILYFLEKHSPILQPWQREILRIVRKVGAYFYPQMQDKVMNEGFACFCHYYIMNRLYEKGLISEGNMMEFISSHSGVIFQTMPDLRSEEQKKKDRRNGKQDPYPYGGLNPYAVGFAMMQDIKRICENPTEEDKKWFPTLIGKNWRDVIIDDVVPNYRDESFIRQFLSPKLPFICYTQ